MKHILSQTNQFPDYLDDKATDCTTDAPSIKAPQMYELVLFSKVFWPSLGPMRPKPLFPKPGNRLA